MSRHDDIPATPAPIRPATRPETPRATRPGTPGATRPETPGATRPATPKGAPPSPPRAALVGLVALGGLMALGGCKGSGGTGSDREARLDPAVQAALDASIAEVDSALATVPRLTRDQLAELRRHLNEEQVATARDLGVGVVDDSAELRRLVREGALVELQDSTRYWVVRELDHSVPFVTPDTHALLEEIGARFHARLDSLGLPPFRFEISSVLRTTAMQASLRQANSNASRTTSSHEFGTTVDIAYNEFSAPAEFEAPTSVLSGSGNGSEEGPGGVPAEARAEVDRRGRSALDSVAMGRAGELQGVLGRVLVRLQAEGKVLPLRERSQPVFHLTVAAERPAARRSAGVAAER